MNTQIADVVVIKDDSVLLVQQRKQSAYGLWSLPGGHVEQDETLEQAVIREVKEELSVDLLDPKFTKTYTIVTEQGTLDLNPFSGELSGDIILKEDELIAYGWFSMSELQDMKNVLRSGCILNQVSDAFLGRG